MTPIIQRLQLTAYRGISNLAIESLSPISLIVGANNSGKSSILEAAAIVLRPPDHAQWASAVRRRDVDLALADGIWSMFPGARSLLADDDLHESSRIVLEAQLGATFRKVEATAWASRIPVSDGAEVSMRVAVIVNGDPPIDLRFPAHKAAPHVVPTFRVFAVTPASHYSTSNLVEQLSQVVEAGRKQLTVQIMRLFDPEVEDLDVTVPLGRQAVRVTHRSRGVVDLSSFGDGMRRSAALALALTRASEGVLLVDELEAGIHPPALRPVFSKLMEAAASAQVQVIATTHSLEAVDALLGASSDLGTSDSLAAYWLQRKEGRHEVRRYDHQRLRELREGGLDIR